MDWREELPVTKQQARKKYGNYGTRGFKTTPEHRAAVDAAHVSVRAQRERLGLAPLNGSLESRADNLRKSYEDMTGFSAYVLGIAMGLQYNPAAGQSKCFNAVESGLTA